MENRPKKRIFIGLLVMTCLILFFLILLVWFIPLVGLKNIHPSLPMIYSLFLALILLSMCLGGLLLILTVIRGKDILFSQKLRGVTTKILFPLMILMGKMIRVSKEKVQQSFIELNNHLVRSNHHRNRPQRLLLLLPHCIQNFDCPIKITGNVKNCKGCGKCEIKDLIELGDKYQVKIAVATGGTLARRIIVENKPEAIVAVACELDLTSGIQDVYPIPVIGILNERPYGPCINTKADIQKVKQAILDFIEPPKSK
ncbi:MAG: DUF116 domain-containing protein [Thermodesulfobacteriota bacterium]